jgi:hypothetical protein
MTCTEHRSLLLFMYHNKTRITFLSFQLVYLHLRLVSCALSNSYRFNEESSCPLHSTENRTAELSRSDLIDDIHAVSLPENHPYRCFRFCSWLRRTTGLHRRKRNPRQQSAARNQIPRGACMICCAVVEIEIEREIEIEIVIVIVIAGRVCVCVIY